MRKVVQAIGFFLLALLSACALAADRIELPLTFERNVPVVHLKIDGRDVPFVLDTGASDSLYLTVAESEAIGGVKKTGQNVKSVDLSGKVAEVPEIQVDALRINDMAFGPLKGRIRTDWGISDGSSGAPKISVLGLSFFGDRKVLLDFPGRRVVVWTPSSSPAEAGEWADLPFTRGKEGIRIELVSSQRRYRMVLDSASTVSLVKRTSVPSGEPLNECSIQMQPGFPCRSLDLTLPTAQSPVFAPMLLSLPEVFPSDGIVGREFFDQYSVVLDLSRDSIRIRRNAQP